MQEIAIVLIFAIAASTTMMGMAMRFRIKLATISQANPKAAAITAETEARILQEVRDLREIVSQQAIIVDDLASMHRRLLEKSDESKAISNRLGSN